MKGAGSNSTGRAKLKALKPDREACSWILMAFRGTPDWIRDHLSFKSIDSHFLSLGDMSGLMMTEAPIDNLLLDRTLEASAARMNFTSTGRDFLASTEYFLRRWMSLMEWDVID